MEKLIKSVDPTASKMVSEAIERLNLAAIDAILECARSGDPLAPMLLGIDPEVFKEVRAVSKADFMRVARTGTMSLVILRFQDAATWRTLRAHGFSKAVMLRELLQEDGFGDQRP